MSYLGPSIQRSSPPARFGFFQERVYRKRIWRFYGLTFGHLVVSVTKLLLILPLMAAFAYVSLVGLMYVSQRALLYPGASPTLAPAHASWGESISIGTPDGETLHGLYRRGESGKPSVLFFLGNADRASNYGFLAQALAARGIGLLAISYRGYPGSTGSPSEDGLLTDGIAAFDWLSTRTEGKIVVLGQSLGSGVAVNTAAQRPAAARHPGVRLPVCPVARTDVLPVRSGCASSSRIPSAPTSE